MVRRRRRTSLLLLDRRRRRKKEVKRLTLQDLWKPRNEDHFRLHPSIETGAFLRRNEFNEIPQRMFVPVEIFIHTSTQ